MSDKILFLLLTGAATVSGFTFGMAVGKGAREEAESNVSTDYDGGVITVQVDAGKALKAGFTDWVANL
ncbi:hypothetical protein [Teredinibacter turnerae]|uniref:hypothetical protein n=1 Tax=Teredinibacter turnerae TaxID=2426 RepID=UPI0005F76B30|nr:hypothetical protein [Teredinibacter turnerae]